MRKSKPGRGRQFEFVAPFALRACLSRLQTKAEKQPGGWLGWFMMVTEVYFQRVNVETVNFIISRGAVVVHGRLDRLTDDSTLVSIDSSINWFTHLFVVARLAVIGLAALPVLGLAYALLWILFNDVAFLLNRLFPLTEVNLLLMGAGVLLVTTYRARCKRAALARLVEKALTDQILDVPDFGGLDEADLWPGMDGELVAVPALKPLRKPVSVHELGALVSPDTRKRKGDV